ncbi:GtrA family protein [Acinetobacter schindleri]|uniref:GtrA family protein n=1 Tax=Acinetobacter schindleri TaxID=108981 RepID=A0AAE6WTQ3_9GAMM|nr:GtrA family protein [Acinetobacter schindleri]
MGCFFIIIKLFFLNQALSNFIGFIVSIVIGYFLNSIWTFNKKINLKKFFLFFFKMGCISILIGWLGDIWNFPNLFTLILSTFSSLIIGFFFSKFLFLRL